MPSSKPLRRKRDTSRRRRSRSRVSVGLRSKERQSRLGVAAVVSGICSILLLCSLLFLSYQQAGELPRIVGGIGFLGPAFGIYGLYAGIVGKGEQAKRTGSAKAGIILSACGVLIFLFIYARGFTIL